jgi:hypothetical protein
MKYMVTSYGPDEKQIFSDFVEAKDANTAQAIVGDARDYATSADVMDAEELRELAARLEASTPPQTAYDLARELDDEPAFVRLGSPEQLRAWVNEDVPDFEGDRRKRLVEEELGERDNSAPAPAARL